MKIIRGIKNLKLKGPTAVTVGIFDGVHKGHRKVLRELVRQARIINGKSCVVTFEPHPLKVLMPKRMPPTVISTAHKMRLLKEEGVDIVAVINFTKDFAAMTPFEFAKRVLKNRLHTKILLVGENFVLGKGRSGNIQHLKEMGRKFGFGVKAVRPLKISGKVISSTLVRKLIMSGDLSGAKRLLGREATVLGTVVRGAQRGRSIGFPTANVDPHHEAIPPSGVYVVKAKVDSKEYRGILNIGFQPTFKEAGCEKEPTVEVHIFGLNRIIYGKDTEIRFLKRLRDESKFKSRQRLSARIKKDVTMAKEYFRRISA